MNGIFVEKVRLPHVTLMPDGAAHLRLPTTALALHEELKATLPAGTCTLHEGWGDLTVAPEAVQAALAIVHRYYPSGDYGARPARA